MNTTQHLWHACSNPKKCLYPSTGPRSASLRVVAS